MPALQAAIAAPSGARQSGSPHLVQIVRELFAGLRRESRRSFTGSEVLQSSISNVDGRNFGRAGGGKRAFRNGKKNYLKAFAEVGGRLGKVAGWFGR